MGFAIKSRRRLVVLVLSCVACGGRSAESTYSPSNGGASGASAGLGGAPMNDAAAGAAALAAGAASGGAAGSASNAGAPNLAGAPSELAGAAGEAGATSDEGGSVDYSRARWPMPNSVASGLPHSRSYDLSREEIVRDNVTGLDWQSASSTEAMPWTAARDYCSQLVLAGASNWRLPSRVELVSLHANIEDSVNSVAPFPNLAGYGGYWSSSFFSYTPAPPTAPGEVSIVDAKWSYWSVGMRNWSVLPVDSLVEAGVRCVRTRLRLFAGNDAPQRSVVGDTVLDAGTGLTWERTPPSEWGSWSAMRDRCAASQLGGYDDWRLPSLQELLSLGELQHLWPAIDPADFPGMETIESGWFWSASGEPEMPPELRPVAVSFGNFYVQQQPPTIDSLARCVR